MRLLPFLLLFFVFRFSLAANLPPPVQAALADAGIPRDAVGIVVYDTARKKSVLTHNASRAFNPASTMKLLTTFAGLELLGPNFSWRTEAYITGEVENGVLSGDLIIKGYGDPSLTLEKFWLLLHKLRLAGLRDIRGNLVLDTQYFSLPAHDPAEFDDKPERAYNVGPQSLLINYKAIEFQISADQKNAFVRADPPLSELKIVNNLTVATGECSQNWRDAIEVGTHNDLKFKTVEFTGSYSPQCGTRSIYLGLFDNTRYVFGVFKKLWEESGGKFAGTVRLGAVPAGSKPLAAQASQPLSEVIRDINKFSNNVMARQLFLTISSELSGEPGSTQNAATIVKQWLITRGLYFDTLVLENGAGLSRKERITPMDLSELLLAAYKSPLMPEFIASLPLLSVDGTMQKRLKGQDISGQAHIKTGSLDQVRAIAGYVQDRRGRLIIVVFLINHNRAAESQGAQDKLLRWVYERA